MYFIFFIFKEEENDLLSSGSSWIPDKRSQTQSSQDTDPIASQDTEGICRAYII